eukprot:5804930-Prymnesium_polylepis.1
MEPGLLGRCPNGASHNRNRVRVVVHGADQQHGPARGSVGHAHDSGWQREPTDCRRCEEKRHTHLVYTPWAPSCSRPWRPWRTFFLRGGRPSRAFTAPERT